MSRAALIACAIALVGCEHWPGVELVQPDEARAREIVWNALGVDGPPPVVHWVAGTCPGAIRPAFTGADGRCYGGLYSPSTHTAQIAWTGRFSTSSYTHELLHAALELRDGDSDPEHTRPEWATVPVQLDALLRAEGL